MIPDPTVMFENLFDDKITRSFFDGKSDLSGSQAHAFSTGEPEKRRQQAHPSNLCLNSAHSVIAGDHRNAQVNIRKKAKCL
jgi:hypothetical protein